MRIPCFLLCIGYLLQPFSSPIWNQDLCRQTRLLFFSYSVWYRCFWLVLTQHSNKPNYNSNLVISTGAMQGMKSLSASLLLVKKQKATFIDRATLVHYTAVNPTLQPGGAAPFAGRGAEWPHRTVINAHSTQGFVPQNKPHWATAASISCHVTP